MAKTDTLLRLADFPAYAAIERKRHELGAMLGEVHRKRTATLDALNAAATPRYVDSDLEYNARRLLGGKDLDQHDAPGTDPRELRKLDAEAKVIEEAIRLHEEDSQPVICELRARIKQAALPTHKALVEAVGRAFDAFVEALAAEQRFREQVRENAGAICLPWMGVREEPAGWRQWAESWHRDACKYLNDPDGHFFHR